MSLVKDDSDEYQVHHLQELGIQVRNDMIVDEQTLDDHMQLSYYHRKIQLQLDMGKWFNVLAKMNGYSKRTPIKLRLNSSRDIELSGKYPRKTKKKLKRIFNI